MLRSRLDGGDPRAKTVERDLAFHDVTVERMRQNTRVLQLSTVAPGTGKDFVQPRVEPHDTFDVGSGPLERPTVSQKRHANGTSIGSCSLLPSS